MPRAGHGGHVLAKSAFLVLSQFQRRQILRVASSCYGVVWRTVFSLSALMSLWMALSHLAFLLLFTYLTVGLGFNRFNGLGSR
jgi:hypothetical protein